MNKSNKKLIVEIKGITTADWEAALIGIKNGANIVLSIEGLRKIYRLYK